MTHSRLLRGGDLYLHDGFWRLRWRENPVDPNEGHRRKPAWIGPATGPERLTKKEAERIAWENFLSRLDQNGCAPQSGTTVADFVAKVFVPEHVSRKKLSGRTHYQAILKHVLKPEQVDGVFQVEPGSSKTKLRAVPSWPYLGDLRLLDVQPDDVQRLISAALARGYSTQTVKHIRNVVSAIFAQATKMKLFAGDNPASHVTLPGMTRKEAHALTLAQVNAVLDVMRYPEREMTLIAILTDLNVAEICGLQWKRVNLTDAWCESDGEPLPPRSIAVRKQWYLGELAAVNKKSRSRDLPIREPLLAVLLGLSRREGFTAPDDFILVSRAGTPVNGNRIGARRLKPIGEKLGMPWLSWRVFRRTHTKLAYELGMQLPDRIAAMMGGSLPSVLPEVHQEFDVNQV